MIAKKKDKLLGLKQRTFPFSFFFFLLRIVASAHNTSYFLKIIRKLIAVLFQIEMANFDQVYLFHH